MGSVGRILYALLLRSMPVFSLVGYPDPVTREPRVGVYPRKAAQGKPFPRVTYLVISTDRSVRTLGKGAGGLVGARVQLECWDPSDLKAGELAQRVIDTLDAGEPDGSFRGRVDRYFVQSIAVEDQDADWEQPAYGDEVGVAREGLEVVVWYEEKPNPS